MQGHYGPVDSDYGILEVDEEYSGSEQMNLQIPGRMRKYSSTFKESRSKKSTQKKLSASEKRTNFKH